MIQVTMSWKHVLISPWGQHIVPIVASSLKKKKRVIYGSLLGKSVSDGFKSFWNPQNSMSSKLWHILKEMVWNKDMSLHHVHACLFKKSESCFILCLVCNQIEFSCQKVWISYLSLKYYYQYSYSMELR